MKLEPPTVVNLKKTTFNVYIGRAVPKYGLIFRSKWANRHLIQGKVTREEAIRRYRRDILNRPDLLMCLPELSGMDIGCFCAPEACHGDVLVDLFEARAWERFYTEIPVYDPDGRVKSVALPFENSPDRVCVRCGKTLVGRQRRWCGDDCVARYELEKGYYYRNIGIRDNLEAHEGKLVCVECGKVINSIMKAHGLFFGVIPHYYPFSGGFVDHIKPLTIGGDHSPGNLQVLCKACNAKKTERDRILIGVAYRMHEKKKFYDFTKRFSKGRERVSVPRTNLSRWMV